MPKHKAEISAEPVSLRVELPASKKTIVVSDRELTGRDREQVDVYASKSGGSNICRANALLSRVCSYVVKDDAGAETLAALVHEDVADMSTRDIDAILKALKAAKDPRFFGLIEEDDEEE